MGLQLSKEDLEKWLKEEAKKNNMSVSEFAKKNSEEVKASIVPLGAEVTTTLKDDIKNTYSKFKSDAQNLSFKIDEDFGEVVNTVGRSFDVAKIGIIAIIVLLLLSLFK